MRESRVDDASRRLLDDALNDATITATVARAARWW
jgi:hypothetical protein